MKNTDAQKIEKKLRLAEGLYFFAYSVKKQQLKLKYPGLNDVELNHKVYSLIEKGCK